MGIGNLTVDQVRQRIQSFDQSYVNDWNTWLTVRRYYPLEHAAPEFGRILRRWQACRPNVMRRCHYDATHDAPYLEDLVHKGLAVAAALNGFDLRYANAMSPTTEDALIRLWDIFRHLSYAGRSRHGLAGVVGISKAVLLLTEGRVGPAFDSKVRKGLGITDIQDARSWITNLERVAEDITIFEQASQCSLRDSVPDQYRSLHCGRLYDMILGPGRNLV